MTGTGLEVQLAAGDVEATFLPDVGLLGVSLRHVGVEVLALPHDVDGYRAGHLTGLPLMAPWANRLGSRRFRAAGVDVDLRGLALHEDAHGLPIHGTMTAQPGWEVVTRTAASFTARFDYGARPDLLAAFPFPHELVVTMALVDDSLVTDTTVRATGDRAVPIAFGWHPYFGLGGDRGRWRLRLPACRHLRLDERGLPTGDTEAQPDEHELLGTRAFDDHYALDGQRQLEIEDDDRGIVVNLLEGYRHVQVYAPAGQPFVCLEPMTAPTNALVTGDHRVVAPGGAFTARYAIRLTLSPRLRG